ncbi:ABC-2 family transporter protein [Clostridium perfringens D]|nr:ABC-2 family transporter protein [Clostridium perfringens D]
MDFFKTIRVYSSFAKGTFKALSSYKANLLMGLIGQLIMISVTYFLWIAIYSSSQEGIMNGFTLKEMLTYVMITLLIGIVTSNDISQEISFEVRDGSISTNLIKPINYRLRIIFIGIGNFIFFFLTLFLPGAILISTYAIYNGININLASIFIFLISIILGCLINIYYSYIFGLLSFKFYNIWGISQIARAIIMLVSGGNDPPYILP